MLKDCIADLDNLLDAPRSQFDGHAEIQISQAILTFQIGRTWQHTFLILHDRLDHLHHCRAGSIEGAATLEQIHDLATAIPCPLHKPVNGLLWQQVRNRDAGDGRITRQWYHRVTMPPQDEGLCIFH